MSPPEFDNTQFAEVTGSAVGDQPTATDSLGFAPYVEALAGFLRSDATAPPLTVSIEGEWGSGKSSFMMQLEQTIAGISRGQLSLAKLPAWLGGDGREVNPWPAVVALFANRQQCTIRFNAWRHDKQDAVWAAFALAVSKRLRARVGFFRAWWGDFCLFWYRISIPSVAFKLLFLTALITLIVAILHHFYPDDQRLKQLVKDAAFLFTESRSVQSTGFWGLFALAVLGALSGLRKIHSPIEKQLKKYIANPGYSEHASFVETFHEDFARVVRAYAGRKRVFVFIDDLDRCDVPKAAELMQAINLMIGESGNLVFILGMDREKVAAGISLKYKELIAFLPEYQSSIAAAPSTPAIPAPAHVTPSADNENRQGDTKADEKVTTQVDPTAPARIAANYLRFGSSYLEKFIQLSFAIPTISRKQDFDRFLDGLAPQPAPAKWHSRFRGYWLQIFKRILSRSSSNEHTIGTASESMEIPSTSPARASEAREERVRQIQIKIGKDAVGVRMVVEMVSPMFGNNPRRLKQFISTFRLALSIYSSQGVLDVRNDRPVATPEQIAKILAFLLRFPDLRSDLVDTPDLFAGLERDALTSSTSPLLNHPGVRKLLVHGVSLSPTEDTPAQNANPFSLQHVDVSFLLSIFPKRAYTELPAGPANARVEVSPGGEASQAERSEAPSEAATQPSEGTPVGSSPKTESYSEAGIRELLTQAGRDYETIRRTQTASPARTAAMTEAVHSIQHKVAEAPAPIIQQLMAEQIKENTEGSRIVALAIAADQISEENMPFLLDMFARFRTPFEHYWCIRALIAHSGFLTQEQASEVIGTYAKNEREITSDSGRAALASLLFDIAKARAADAQSSSPAAMA